MKNKNNNNYNISNILFNNTKLYKKTFHNLHTYKQILMKSIIFHTFFNIT